MKAKFKIGEKVRHISDCVTIFKVVNVNQTNVNYFYDIEGKNLPLKGVPEQELSLVEKD